MKLPARLSGCKGFCAVAESENRGPHGVDLLSRVASSRLPDRKAVIDEPLTFAALLRGRR